MSLTLTNTKGGNFDPHPEGVWPSVCVDVLDQGLLPTTFNGKTTLKPKIKLVFESEALLPTGVRATVSKSVTASLAPKSNLAAILGKWRGRPVGDNEQIDLDKLLGACCTLVISHAPSADGTKVYANIDAISKPTKKVVPSGTYDGVAARQRFAEWKAKNNLPPMPTPEPAGQAVAAAAQSPMEKISRRASKGEAANYLRRATIGGRGSVCRRWIGFSPLSLTRLRHPLPLLRARDKATGNAGTKGFVLVDAGFEGNPCFALAGGDDLVVVLAGCSGLNRISGVGQEPLHQFFGSFHNLFFTEPKFASVVSRPSRRSGSPSLPPWE